MFIFLGLIVAVCFILLGLVDVLLCLRAAGPVVILFILRKLSWGEGFIEDRDLVKVDGGVHEHLVIVTKRLLQGEEGLIIIPV